MADEKEPVKPSSLGPAFNATGRDDTTTEILTQQIDSATKMRRTYLISGVVVAIAIMLFLSYLRNPINPFAPPDESKIKFNAPEHKPD